jgi:uncharacterized protein YndB with AHSA1/START domain
MVEFSDTIVVRAPAEATWAVLTAVEGWPSWTPSMRRVVQLSPAPLAEGSQVRVWQPRMAPLTWTVDHFVPGERFSWTTTNPGVTSFADHRLQPVADGTRVELVVRHDGPLARLTSRIYANLTRRYLRAEAEGLKARVEALSGGR